MKHSTPPVHKAGFSLVELLVVMAVLVGLMAMVVPAMRGLGGAGDLTKTTSDLGTLLDGARAQAMARNTYVWVGFATDQEATPTPNESQLVVAVKTSPDGTRPTDFSAANLLQLGKAEKFTNVRLSSVQSDYQGTRPVADKQLAEAATMTSFKADRDGATYEFKRVLEFNSAGEVRILGDASLPRLIEIGLQPTHGKSPDTNGNSAALQIAGLTGQTRIFRP